jgi:preprotein translocase subunit SecD
MLASLLLISIATQDGCLPDAPVAQPQSESKPLQKAGNGLWIGGIGFTAADIASAEPQTEQYTGQPTLSLTFTPSGNAKFLEAQRCGENRPVEISLDGVTLSRPILRGGQITGGKAMIAGGWDSLDAVQAIATRILKH